GVPRPARLLRACEEPAQRVVGIGDEAVEAGCRVVLREAHLPTVAAAVDLSARAVDDRRDVETVARSRYRGLAADRHVRAVAEALRRVVLLFVERLARRQGHPARCLDDRTDRLDR